MRPSSDRRNCRGRGDSSRYLGRPENPGSTIAWSAAIGAVAALIGAGAKYLSFRYRLSGDSLVIDSGVLQKQHRVIPLASVQNVDIRESALQRIFNVAAMALETATGGRDADAEFAVLGRAAAESLREEILARRLRARPAAATANHAGIIVAALAGAFQMVDDLPYFGWAQALVERISFDRLESALLIGLGVIGILLLAGWILSILGSVVRYYDFTLTSRTGQLHKSHGLLGRQRTTIPLARIQAMRVEESALRRPLGLAALRVTTAGAAVRQQERRGADTIAPITPSEELARLVASVFPTLTYDDVVLRPVHPRSRSRAFTKYAVTLLLAAGAVAAWRAQLAVVPLLLLVPAWLMAAWQYRHRAFATITDYVIARNGAFNRITWLVPERKLQTLHLKESPFQRRHGLASVLLDTAGGGGRASVHDLGYDDAVQLIHSLRQRYVRPPSASGTRLA